MLIGNANSYRFGAAIQILTEISGLVMELDFKTSGWKKQTALISLYRHLVEAERLTGTECHLIQLGWGVWAKYTLEWFDETLVMPLESGSVTNLDDFFREDTGNGLGWKQFVFALTGPRLGVYLAEVVLNLMFLFDRIDRVYGEPIIGSLIPPERGPITSSIRDHFIARLTTKTSG